VTPKDKVTYWMQKVDKHVQMIVAISSELIESWAALAQSLKELIESYEAEISKLKRSRETSE